MLRHGYYVQQVDGSIRHSVISVFLAPVFVAFGKLRPCRRKLRIPTPSVLHSRKCVRYAGTSTGSMCLQFGTSSGGKEVTKELQLYKSTFPNRSEPTLHTSPPWSGRDRRACMGPQYFTFPTFSTYIVWNMCRCLHSRWLLAPRCPSTALYP
jgi:hypothetical protein